MMHVIAESQVAFYVIPIIFFSVFEFRLHSEVKVCILYVLDGVSEVLFM